MSREDKISLDEEEISCIKTYPVLVVWYLVLLLAGDKVILILTSLRNFCYNLYLLIILRVPEVHSTVIFFLCVQEVDGHDFPAKGGKLCEIVLVYICRRI
jgi:hypothetical protein